MIQFAILGLGTVGGGVAKVVTENAAEIEKRLGEPLVLKTVLVRHFRDGAFRSLMTDDFSVIEKDPEIAVVVETIGGVEAAYEYTRRALQAGKHVVTANKQLVAEKGSELLALAKANGVRYLFEASVGGGIPILHPLTQCLTANRIEEIYGILNGTTNYILTQMIECGATFESALRAAQEKGYAEADPTADVEGIDAGRKTCILADLAFGQEVAPERVPMEGITRLSLQDVEIAAAAGFRVKLLGHALRRNDGHTAYVAPHLVPEEHPLAHVNDVFNAVVVRGNAVGETMFYGRGAGEYPTASACVSDVLECVSGADRGLTCWDAAGEGFADPQEVTSRFYLRIAEGAEAAQAAFGPVTLLAAQEGTTFLTEPLSGRECGKRAEGLGVQACLRVMD